MTMEAVDRLFVDTNILVYSTDGLSPWYDASNQLLETARNRDVELIVSTQIMREYLAVTTRSSITSNGPPLTDILTNLQNFQAEFRVVEENLTVLAALVELLQNFPTAGRQVYDANIVATMQVYEIRHLLTYNTGDFARFSELISLIPLVEV